MQSLSYLFKVPTINYHRLSSYLRYIAIAALAFGIVLRIAHYVSNRSLWADEAYLALNLVDRSYLELLKPLDYDQAAPPLFLWIEKSALQLFGNHEYSLRFFPLIAGIIALLAFYKLGKWAVSQLALAIAMLFFACLQYTVYYATELKQYCSDVMVTLLLCLLLIPLRNRDLSGGKVLWIGLLGAIAIWLSHPAIFVLTGLELANLIIISQERRKVVMLNRWPAYLIWLIGFAVLYFQVLSQAMKNQSLQSQWGGEYPGSIFDLVWLLDSFGRIFYRPLGFASPADGVAIVAFIIGCVACYRANRYKLLVLFAPVAVTLVATYLHKYPFRGRLILFLAPFFILILAEGLAFLLAQWNQRRLVGLFGVGLTAFLLLPPLFQTGRSLFIPPTVQEIRPVIEHIKAHYQPGDLIYADSPGAIIQFTYYSNRYGFPRSALTHGAGNLFAKDGFTEESWHRFKQQSKGLSSNKRMWLIFTGLERRRAESVKARLSLIGQELDYFQQPRAFTYLYQLK